MLHKTAMTKQWATEWSCIANVVFRIVKSHGEKSDFFRF